MDDCRFVIDALVDAGFLAWTPRRTIVRRGAIRWDTPRLADSRHFCLSNEASGQICPESGISDLVVSSQASSLKLVPPLHPARPERPSSSLFSQYGLDAAYDEMFDPEGGLGHITGP